MKLAKLLPKPISVTQIVYYYESAQQADELRQDINNFFRNNSDISGEFISNHEFKIWRKVGISASNGRLTNIKGHLFRNDDGTARVSLTLREANLPGATVLSVFIAMIVMLCIAPFSTNVRPSVNYKVLSIVAIPVLLFVLWLTDILSSKDAGAEKTGLTNDFAGMLQLQLIQKS